MWEEKEGELSDFFNWKHALLGSDGHTAGIHFF